MSVKNYKMHARLPVAKSPLKNQPPQTIRIAKRSVQGTAVPMRPPSVGKLIERKKTNPETGEVQVIQRFKMQGYLGKGGFANVYSVSELDTREIYAAKVIQKATLKRRTKEKLASEIRIHAMLRHKHIVKYVTFFEDSSCCYILMELCSNKSLAELIRTRKRLSEPEVRYYMYQLLDAIAYMHNKRIIHRDLKLGNIFLNDDLQVKVGDFGLATRLQNENDRRRTLCGTPNYMAPEVLERGDNGHSYEADIWSVGVIMYTLIIGKPPFETNNLESTYKRIKENNYTFPENVDISLTAKKLIRKMLTSIPEQRPSVQEILGDEFFINNFIPRLLPRSALTSAPVFSASFMASQMAEFTSTENRPPLTDTTNTVVVVGGKEKRAADAIAEAKAQIALANNPSAPAPAKEPIPHSARGTANKDLAAIFGSKPAHPLDNIENVENVDPAKARKRLRSPLKNNETSPAKQRQCRSHIHAVSSCKRLIDDFEGKEDKKDTNLGPAKRVSLTSAVPESDVQDKNENLDDENEGEEERVTIRVHRTLTDSFARLSMHDHGQAAERKSSVRGFSNRVESQGQAIYGEDGTSKVGWVRKWFDFSKKYGLAYQLQDGSVGALFNDNTTLIQKCLEPDTGAGCKIDKEFLYIYNKETRRGQRAQTERHSLDKVPPELSKKVHLLKVFRDYFDQENKTTSVIVEAKFDEERARSARSPVLYVDAWFHRKHATFFRLSNRIVQANFTDESKVILSSDGKMVTYVDKTGQVQVHTLDYVVQNPNPPLVYRLKYTRDTLGDLLQPRDNAYRGNF